MEQFRQLGEALGSIRALMTFKDQIRINQQQCCLIFDMFNLAFDGVAEEISQNLKFGERSTKWKEIEQPLRTLYLVFKDGESYIRRCLETKDWWAHAISLAKNNDCVELHIHNLLWCAAVVMESIEVADEISCCDEEEMREKRIMSMKKYEKEWMDPKFFQRKFGKQYLVSKDLCNKIESAWREDRWLLLGMIGEKGSVSSSSPPSKQEQKIAELLSKNLEGLVEPSKGKFFPSSLLVGSVDYKMKRRLGNGNQYKEIEWMGESFAVRHFFGDIEPLVQDISLLSSLSHPNVMNVFCCFSDEEKKECFLLMELMNKDLSSFTKEVCGPKRRIPFSLPVAVDIMLQIARGMEYLHSRSIYHGDLNSSNVLVKNKPSSTDGYLQAKITGFRLSSLNHSAARTSSNQAPAGPSIWYAPEVLVEQEQAETSTNSKYTEKADVYSFGMICFELLTGKVAFEDGHMQGEKVSRNIRVGERPLFPFHTPKYLATLTKKCWQMDPSHRPTFASISRILRYTKRFLVMNPDHSQPDPPLPPVEFCDLETSISRKLPSWTSTQVSPFVQIPFQMFAYRVVEKEKTTVKMKEKSSESGSDGASQHGDDQSLVGYDAFSTPRSRSPSTRFTQQNRNTPARRTVDGKATKNSGSKTKAFRPPQLTPIRSSRENTQGQLQPMLHNTSRRKSSGHASDSELI